MCIVRTEKGKKNNNSGHVITLSQKGFVEHLTTLLWSK